MLKAKLPPFLTSSFDFERKPAICLEENDPPLFLLVHASSSLELETISSNVIRQRYLIFLQH